MAKTLSTGFVSDVINGIRVNTSIKCHSSNLNNKSSRNIVYIVMHYTGNAKDNAKNNANYFAGANRNASAHFFVDDNNIYQIVEIRDVAWHCGAKKYYHSACRNANSIGIEQCCTAGNYKISEKTKKNSAYLCAYNCKLVGITADMVDTYVLRHYDVTHKSCPAQMAGENNAEWVAFKNMVKDILRSGAISDNTPVPTPVPTVDYTEQPVAEYGVRVVEDVLNVRKGPGTNYPVVTKITDKGIYTIVEEVKNGNTIWGKLKSGRGYISLGYTRKLSGGTSTPVPTPAPTPAPTFTEYKVRVTANTLNVRKGPGTNYNVATQITDKGIYTIVEEVKNGNTIWGKLKSKVGWISLEYTTKV